MTNFIVYVEQLEYEEYEVVVEAKSIKSVKEEWEGISDVVNEYCYNDATEYLDDDGTPVEPVYYAPIIPLILVNGSKGIGTGFSTDIMCYNPLQIIYTLRSILKKQKSDITIEPYYEGFKGTIEKIQKVELFEELNLNPEKETILMTYHPVTQGASINHEDQLRNIFKVLNNYNFQLFITAPNTDYRWSELQKIIDEEISSNKNLTMAKSLGIKRYYNLVKNCKFVIGN